MFGGHWYELIIVLVIALVIFGPRRLPELGATLGAGIHALRKATSDDHDDTPVEDPRAPSAE